MWIYWILSLAAVGVVSYVKGAERARKMLDPVIIHAPNVARVITWNLDLDAVQAAGDRAVMAVRADQATRAPRAERRHLRAVA